MSVEAFGTMSSVTLGGTKVSKGEAVSPITLNTKPGTQDAFDALAELTLLVEDFGEPANSDLANELIEVGRRIELQQDAKMRMTSPDAEPFDGRVFVMNDLLLIGRYRVYKKKENARPKSKKGKGRKKSKKSGRTSRHGSKSQTTLRNQGTLELDPTSFDDHDDHETLGEVMDPKDLDDKVVMGVEGGFKTNDQGNVNVAGFGTAEFEESGDALHTIPSSSEHSEEESHDHHEDGESEDATAAGNGHRNRANKKSKKKKPHLKIKVFIALYGNVSVSEVHDPNGNHGIRLEVKEKDYEEREDGYVETKLISRHTAIFFDTKEQMEPVYKKIREVQNKLVELEIQREEEALLAEEREYREHKKSERSKNSLYTSGTSEDGTVDFAEENSSVGEDGEDQGNDGTVDAETTSTTSKGTKKSKPLPFKRKMLTAKKISHARAQLDGDKRTEALKTLHKEADSLMVKRQLIPTKNTGDVYTVEFNGPMGFALTSGNTPDNFGNVIVFVGKLDDNGAARKAGVVLGDKIIEIGGIKKEKLWTQQDCVRLIEKKKNETGPDGKPIPLVLKFSKLARQDEMKVEEMEARKEREKTRRKGLTKVAQAIDVGRTFGIRDPNGKRSKRILNRHQREAAREIQEKCDDIFDRIIQNSKSEDEKQCAYVMREIHSTEKGYLTDLYCLQDLYMEKMMKTMRKISCKENAMLTGSEVCEHGIPVQTCEEESSVEKPLLNAQDKKLIFANLETIVKLNEELMGQVQKGLLALYDRMDTFEDPDLGVVELAEIMISPFLKMTPFFGMYAQYASRYSKAMDRWKELREGSDEFAAMAKEIEGYRKVKAFSTLLISPITRLTKYPLLFQQLQKRLKKYLASHVLTDLVDHLEKHGEEAAKSLIKKEHEEKLVRIQSLIPNMEKVEKMLTEVAASVNLKVDEQFKMEILDALYDELGGVQHVKDFFKPHRRFVKRYENIVFEENKGNKYVTRRDRVIIILNDMIIVGGYSKTAKKTLNAGDIKRRSTRNPPLNKRNSTAGSSSGNGQGTMDKSMLARMAKKQQAGLGGVFGSFLSANKAKQPDILIDYILDLKQVQAKPLPRKGPEEQPGTMLVMKLTEEDLIRINGNKKKKKSLELEDGPTIYKIDIFFETMELRNDFEGLIDSQRKIIKENEESILRAQRALGYHKEDLREAREEKMKQRAEITGVSTTIQRTETLKKKLADMRAAKKKKSQG